MIYLQISTGRGPDECVIALAHILDKMRDDRSETPLQVIRETGYSAIVAIDGHLAREYANSWIGTILWVCQSPLRPSHKRKNWFVGIREITLNEHKAPIDIFDRDLEWQTMKSSGKGGQHAQKNDTAVRLIHKPTGISVISEDERSQKQNKTIALSRLYAVFSKRQEDAFKALEAENWQQHNEIERGNPIRTFDGPKFRQRA